MSEPEPKKTESPKKEEEEDENVKKLKSDALEMQPAIQALIDELKIKEWQDDNIQKIIEEKLNCHYLQKRLVKTFEKFLENTLFKPHFHSKNNDKNIKEALPIFYRHGISKIMTKIIEDVANDKVISTFFLDDILKQLIDLDYELFSKIIHNDNIEKDFLMHWMDMAKNNKKNIDSFFENNSNNAVMMNALLLNLYDESDFHDLVNSCEEIPEGEKQSWKDYYDNADIEERVKDEEKQTYMGINFKGLLAPKTKKTDNNYKVISKQNIFEDFI